VAKETNTIKIGIKTFGGEELKKLGATFGKINKTLVLNKKNLNETVASILRIDKRAKSFNGEYARSNKIIKEQIAAFKVLRDQVDKGGASYSRFTNEINKLNASLSIQPGTQYASPIGPQMDTRGRFAKMRDRFIGSAKNMGVGQRAALGAIAGAGVAGNLGAVGSFGLSGAAVGGPAGAAVGAAIGGVVETVKAASAAAKYAAQIGRLEIALKGVTKTQGEFNKAQRIIADVSDELNVPIGASTKQFTTLSASVIGAGGNVDDAEKVFRGVSEAIKATGGDAEDVQSAIRAMSQIFGKGKVSAEELQGQLGERLPGAVVKFADATGRTLPQLQKDLRDGTVGLNDVMKFVAKLSKDHRDAALEMANSSMDAGQKLQVSMQKLQLNIGRIMQPIGAAIQKTMTVIVNAINGAIEAFRRFFGIGDENQRRKLENTLRAAIESAKRLEGTRREGIAKGRVSVARSNLLDFLEGYETGGGEGSNFQDPTGDDKDKSSLKTFAETAFDVAKQAQDAFVNAFKGMEDALVKFVQTGKLNFRDLANSIIADLTRMLVRYAVVQPLFHGITGGRFKNANGNVIDAGNTIKQYARGGIVTRPTLFPMANGMGLMGEAGPEAIMPLKRGANGKLGVQSSGGVGNIVVNVDASGSSVEGDSARSQEFGRALAAAIQSEMIKQKRPGGLLT
tara:strand:- start:1292 stop:3331 length:2040 start_codon:yes stop_codon:yes gene_type:complete